MKENEEDWDELLGKKSNAHAFCSVHTHYGSGLIVLPPYEDTWKFWETVMHELTHYVKFLCENISAEKEQELRAYMHEYLFRKIRRILQGDEPKPRI